MVAASRSVSVNAGLMRPYEPTAWESIQFEHATDAQSAIGATGIYVASRIHVDSRIYVDSCAQIAAVTAAYELRQFLLQVPVNTEKIDHSMEQHRRVLYDAHKRISSVTKGVQKPAK